MNKLLTTQEFSDVCLKTQLEVNIRLAEEAVAELVKRGYSLSFTEENVPHRTSYKWPITLVDVFRRHPYERKIMMKVTKTTVL